jgi:hypothetical protein
VNPARIRAGLKLHRRIRKLYKVLDEAQMFYKIRPSVKNGGLCGSHEPLDPYPSQDGSPAVLTAYLRRPFDVYPKANIKEGAF